MMINYRVLRKKPTKKEDKYIEGPVQGSVSGSWCFFWYYNSRGRTLKGEKIPDLYELQIQLHSGEWRKVKEVEIELANDIEELTQYGVRNDKGASLKVFRGTYRKNRITGHKWKLRLLSGEWRKVKEAEIKFANDIDELIQLGVKNE